MAATNLGGLRPWRRRQFLCTLGPFAGWHEVRRHGDQAPTEQTAKFSALPPQAALLRESLSDMAGLAFKPLRTGLADNPSTELNVSLTGAASA